MSTAITSAEKQLLAIAGGDPEKAARLLDAIENHRRQAAWVKYWEPHDHQQQFWSTLKPEQDIWLVLGGNGAGKSAVGSFMCAAWLLGKDYFRGEVNEKWVDALPIPDPPTNVRGVALNTDMLRDPLWKKLTGAAEHPSMIPQGEITHINNQNFTISIKNGSQFQGKSADTDPKTHGGATCDLVWIDEECKHEIFKENLMRTRNGGKLLVTATPLDDVGTTQHPWIFDLIEQWRAGDETIGIIFMAMDKNPHLDPDFVRRQKTRLAGKPDEQARLYGIPTRRSGLFYKSWRAEAPLWTPARELPKGCYRAVCIDPASTGPVGAVWAAFDGRGKMTVYRTYKQAGLTASQHIQNILIENRGEPIDLWLMDPWRGKQRQEGDLKQVVQIWRDAGLPRLRLPDLEYDVCLEESREYIEAAFDETSPHPPLEVFDHCAEFKDEIERYIIDSVAQGARKGTVKDVPRKGHDDVLNAWQYLCGMRLRARSDTSYKLIDSSLRSYD